jgi:hypothetical protein
MIHYNFRLEEGRRRQRHVAMLHAHSQTNNGCLNVRLCAILFQPYIWIGNIPRVITRSWAVTRFVPTSRQRGRFGHGVSSAVHSFQIRLVAKRDRPSKLYHKNYSRFQTIGTCTKRRLFKNKGHVRQIDNTSQHFTAETMTNNGPTYLQAYVLQATGSLS